MFKYNNQVCEVCQQTFDKDDDIVVCPECGTPHHRQCWFDHGDCVNRHRHAEGFEWSPVVKEVPAGSIQCPDCGSYMPAGTQFCENCGKSLAQPLQQGTAGPQTFNTMGGGRIEIHTIPPMGMGMGFDTGALGADIDGIPARDMAAYIGPNAHYYLFKFRRMNENKKYRPFNVAAFAFRPLWFLYRKLWKFAILAAVLNFTTSLPTAIAMAVDMGALASSYMFPGIETLMSAGQIINFVVNVIFGFMAVPMYKKETVKALQTFRTEAGSDNNAYYTKLLSNSGPSKVGTAVIFFFAVYYIFQMLFAV